MHKLKILFIAICGELIKLYYRFSSATIYYGLNTSEKRKEKVIVSLTSYGRRVSTVLPYTIISLLKQTYKPDVVVLWLDSNKWNDQNLPKHLDRLRGYGLTIEYCKDVKSYTKLIPALKAYPNDIIITFDDDIYYRKDVVKRLIDEYQNNPLCIYAHIAHRVSFSPKGELLPYNDWEKNISGIDGGIVFPTGVGGCLYKSSLLYKDVCREDLFVSLAPKADDVWFYFMEVLQGTNRKVLPYMGLGHIPLDAFFQYLHKDSNLSNTNCKESQNDVQIRQVMGYYNISAKELLNN